MMPRYRLTQRGMLLRFVLELATLVIIVGLIEGSVPR